MKTNALILTILFNILVINNYSQTNKNSLLINERLNKIGANIDRKNLFSDPLEKIDIKHIVESKSSLIISGTDTLYINSDTTVYNDIVIMEQGVLLVDNAKLTLYGHLYGQNQGQAIFRNSAYLYVPQQYLSQYPQIFRDSARFEAINATVYGNTVYRTLLYGSSEYIARNTYFPHWNFRQLYDNSRLIMEDANIVGDLTIDDSCEVHFLRCDTIIPWFRIKDGDSVNIQFPDYDTVDHFLFDTTNSGIEGIKYTVSFDSCHMVLFGIDSWPGGNISINNSAFYSCLRLPGSDTVYLSNITNQAFYPSLSLPLADRNFHITNSYTQLWCIYVYDNTLLYMDSCFWGETHAKDSSAIYAVNCSTNGFPSSVTSTENGYFSFVNGEVTAFVSSWNRATTYIENTFVTPTGTGGQSQTTNFAHHHSYLLAVNSYFEYEPEALDTALVMVTRIDTLVTEQVGTNINIYGSAWIDAGNESSVTFDGYKLYWSPYNDSVWTLINESTDSVYNNTLGIWNTTGLDTGKYDLRLTEWSNEGDSLSALRVITLIDTLTNINTIENYSTFDIYPNPTSGIFTIEGENLPTGQAGIQSIEITNISGQVIRQYSIINNQLEVDLSEQPKGIYFVKVITGKGIAIKKIVVE